jgi:hypothetical protein
VALYAVLWASLLAGVIILGAGHLDRDLRGWADAGVFITALVAVPIDLLLLLTPRSDSAPAVRLIANWSDYHLAGLSGRQMLRAVAGPAITAHIVLGLTQGLLMCAFIIIRLPAMETPETLWWACVSLGLLGAYWTAALPPLSISLAVCAASRHAQILIFALFVGASPLLAALALSAFGHRVEWPQAATWEMFSWLPRLALVVWLWERAASLLVHRADDSRRVEDTEAGPPVNYP